MSEKITVPTLGESVTEATVSKWLKSEGEKVSADEPLVELETDKVNVEVPSPSSGVLGSITVKEGETVNVGSLLGTVSNSTTESVKNEEVKNYNPPVKTGKQSGPRIFDDQNELKTKKEKVQKKIEPILKLDEEEPLILDQVHKEKVVQKKKRKFRQLPEKWLKKLKLI